MHLMVVCAPMLTNMNADLFTFLVVVLVVTITAARPLANYIA